MGCLNYYLTFHAAAELDKLAHQAQGDYPNIVQQYNPWREPIDRLAKTDR